MFEQNNQNQNLSYKTFEKLITVEYQKLNRSNLKIDLNARVQ